jgi:hypothetical protein
MKKHVRFTFPFLFLRSMTVIARSMRHNRVCIKDHAAFFGDVPP